MNHHPIPRKLLLKSLVQLEKGNVKDAEKL